jgi:hypothetical protein
VLFYVLVEHKRDVEPLAMFQVGRYMHRIWDKVLGDEPGLAKLPAIGPVLLCNATTGWTAATKFQDIIDLPAEAREALLPHTPCFGAQLVDLHPAAARGIVDRMLTAFGKLVLWALSVAGDDARFLAEIAQMNAAINAALDAPDAHDALCSLLRYLSATHQRLGAKRIGKLLKAEATRRQEKVVMDVLDELRQEGREEGREEGQRIGERIGERNGRAQLLLKQLTARFGPVSAEAKAQVLAAKQPALERWALRVLTASSLQAVLGSHTHRAKKTAPARSARRTTRAAHAR